MALPQTEKSNSLTPMATAIWKWFATGTRPYGWGNIQQDVGKLSGRYGNGTFYISVNITRRSLTTEIALPPNIFRRREPSLNRRKEHSEYACRNEIIKDECGDEKGTWTDFARLDEQEEYQLQQNLQDGMFAKYWTDWADAKSIADFSDEKMTRDFMSEDYWGRNSRNNEKFIWDIHGR